MIESLLRPSAAGRSAGPRANARAASIGRDLEQASLGTQAGHAASDWSFRGTAPAPDAALSGLRFVAVQAIRPHEQYATAHRDDLRARLDHDGVLRNPIVVAEVRPRAYVLLDGTHRLAYLQQHGYSHALVQVVHLADPTSVRLSTWAHLASVDEGALLVGLARSGLGAVTAARDQAGAAPSARTDVAWLTFARRPQVVYRLRSHDRLAALSTLLTLYEPERLASDALPSSGGRVSEAAFRTSPARNLLVQFAPFGAGEIGALYDAGDRIPSGITRVVISGAGSWAPMYPSGCSGRRRPSTSARRGWPGLPGAAHAASPDRPWCTSRVRAATPSHS